MLAKDIGAKQFRTVRLKEGYDCDEVDEFLDEVELEFAKLQAHVQNLEAQLKKRTEAPTQVMQPVTPPSPVETADRLLRVAEATAQGHIDEARGKADEIVRKAGADAAQIVEDAVSADVEIKRAANGEAENILAAARSQEVVVRQQVESLTRQLDEMNERRKTYKSWLQSTLAKMDEEEITSG